MARRKSELADKAYNYLLERIIGFEILPGEVISDSNVANLLEMSREPVREAFMRLEAEGLLERGKHSVHCAELSLDDIKEICQLRSALESLAVELIKEKGGLLPSQKEELTFVMGEMKKNTVPMITDVDSSKVRYHWDDVFHSTIVQFSGNKRLINMFSLMQLQISRARWLNIISPRTEASMDEHAKIFNALMKDNYDECIDLVKEHIRASEENFIRIINSPEYRMVYAGMSMMGKSK